MRRKLVTVLSGAGALVALAVMIAAIVAGPGDTEAPGASGPFGAGSLTVGLQDDQLTVVSPELVPARIERLASSGTRFTRVDVRWLEVAARRPASPEDPEDPAYAWGRYDEILDGLRARRIEAILAISGAPAWTNGGKGPEWAPDPADYGAFVRALATRYDGRLHARVRLYETWNEPNNPAFLMPQWDTTATPAVAASPKTYAALLKRAFTDIKAVSPDALVIGLSSAHIETSAPPVGGVGVADFIQGLAAERPPMDAAALHLVPGGPPNASSEAIPSFATLPRIVTEIDRIAPGVPLLVTQFGYATGPGGVSEADQATDLTQALERLAAVPRIRLAIWLGMQDTPERAAGLLHADGSEKPAWGVFVNGPKVLPSAAP